MADRKDRLATPVSSSDTLENLVSKLVTRTHLEKSTIRDLLQKQWKYVEEKDNAPRWVRNNF